MFLFILPVFLIRYLLVFIVARNRMAALDYFPDTIGIEKAGKLSYLLINTILLFYPLFMTIDTIFQPVIAGVVLYLVGMLGYLKSVLDFIGSDGFINTGLYRISRNPQAVSFIIIYIAIAIISNSLIYFVLSICLLVSFIILAKSEERYCLQLYGNVYKNYMKETSRFIGFKLISKILNA